MMTELQSFLFMLNRAKVAHKYERVDLDEQEDHPAGWTGCPAGAFWKVHIGVYGGSNSDEDNVAGYGMFYTEFYFDEHGRLLKVGIWE